MPDPAGSRAESPEGASIAPKFYVMPERFLALTRAAKLPPQAMAPPPAVAAPPPPMPAPPSPVLASAAVTATAAPAPVTVAAPVSGRRRMFILWGAIGGGVLFLGGIAAFFVLRSVPAPSAPPPPASATVPLPEPTPPVNAPLPEPTPPPPPAPHEDTDGDGLTNAEEAVFGTDVAQRDTDNDGFDDGLEIRNLYNPTGVAPQRLLDAGLVTEYTHPREEWRIFVPRGWSVGGDDPNRELKVTPEHDSEERVTLTVNDNPERKRFTAWIEAGGKGEAPPSIIDQFEEFQTKRGGTGYRRKANVVGYQSSIDVPVAYVALVPSPAPSPILTIAHDLERVPPRYPHVYAMIVESFAPPRSR